MFSKYCSFIARVLFLLMANATAAGFEFPSCTVGDEPVRYYAVDAATLLRHNVAVAMAGRDMSGAPAIFFDRDLFGGFTPVFRRWVFAHECAHWQLGHFAKPPSQIDEPAADCYAARHLVHSGLSVDDQLAVLQQMDRVEVGYSSGQQNHFKGYPAFRTDRTALVRWCFDSAKK